MHEEIFISPQCEGATYPMRDILQGCSSNRMELTYISKASLFKGINY